MFMVAPSGRTNPAVLGETPRLSRALAEVCGGIAGKLRRGSSCDWSWASGRDAGSKAVRPKRNAVTAVACRVWLDPVGHC